MFVWILYSHGRLEGTPKEGMVVVGIVGVYGSEEKVNEAYDTLVSVHPDATYSINKWAVEA